MEDVSRRSKLFFICAHIPILTTRFFAWFLCFFFCTDPFLDPTVGNNIEIDDAPPPEDFFYLTTTTSYLAIHLTATDSSGLSSTSILEIQPRLVNLEFDTIPTGIPIHINQDKYETPASIIGWENDKFEIRAPTRRSGDDNEKLVFASWSDGMAEHTRDFVVPSVTDPDPIVALFEQEEEEEAIYEPEMESQDGGDDAEVPGLSPVDDNGDAIKKSTKFIVSLLDMSVSVRFGNDIERRRRLSDGSDLISLLEDEVKDTVTDAMSGAIVSAINMPGSQSAPLHGIRFARKGEKASVDDGGLLYTSTFGGLAVFDREDEAQEVPTEFMIQSMQVKAVSEVEDELLSDLREYVAEAGDMMGYSHVRSVSAEVIAKPGTESSTKESSGTDPVYVGLLVIAILLMLLILAGVITFYAIRHKSRKESSAAFCIEAMADDSSKGSHGKKQGTHEGMASGSDTDDESPMNSPVKQRPYSYDPYSTGNNRPLIMLPDDDNDDDSSAASSVASSVESIARNLVHSLSSVLGPSDRDEDYKEGDEDSLKAVVGHDKGHLVQNAGTSSIAAIDARQID